MHIFRLMEHVWMESLRAGAGVLSGDGSTIKKSFESRAIGPEPLPSGLPYPDKVHCSWDADFTPARAAPLSWQPGLLGRLPSKDCITFTFSLIVEVFYCELLLHVMFLKESAKPPVTVCVICWAAMASRFHSTSPSVEELSALRRSDAAASSLRVLHRLRVVTKATQWGGSLVGLLSQLQLYFSFTLFLCTIIR